ncbi:Transmembrane protein 53-B [Cytospora mali]|uniref:Transmembrane protein 53-B n=1 Tax=Cytospora mali TaxID=578113 RepID=A0A194W9M4_CYTMA|nr:Transmembrane protein 53-B [Valsa mali]
MSLLDFKDLGDDISLYEPHIQFENGHRDCCHSPGPPQTRLDSPSLIILCTWLGGATSKRIERYTQQYHNTWPSSSILLIRTSLLNYVARSERSLHRRLRPAHREIRRIAIDACSNPTCTKPAVVDGGILLHMFSQGGANIATHLVTSLNSILATMGRDIPLPLRQIVLDSCPGDPDINSSYAAAAHSLPGAHPLRPLGCAVLYVMVASLLGLEATGIRKPLARVMRAQLNDPGIFSPRAARLYLTSRADKIVDARHVEAHAQQAAAIGLKTEILAFNKAGHCSLILEDGSAYWDAIVSSWERNRLPEMTEIWGRHSHNNSSPVDSGEWRSRL